MNRPTRENNVFNFYIILLIRRPQSLLTVKMGWEEDSGVRVFQKQGDAAMKSIHKSSICARLLCAQGVWWGQ